MSERIATAAVQANHHSGTAANTEAIPALVGRGADMLETIIE